MKKIFYLMSVCALAFISCQKEEMADNAQSGKFNYTFTANHVLDTKATVSDKTDNKWPVLWEKGDQLGVYLADGTFVGIANLTDESAGKNSGTFTLSTETEIADGTALKFSYPYVENAVSGTGVVAAEQTLASAASAGVGANAVAFAEAVYVQGQTNVVLNHVNAYLKFNIASAEDAFAGYNLDGITLWADDAAVSGNIDGNAYSNTGDYVKVSLTSPVTVGTQAQPLWLTSLPADLSECKKVYAIVHMSKGTETVTLPVRLNGAGNLPAGSVTEITLPSLTKSLAPAWYEPVETRYIAAYGEGWCYGPENTVLFTAKNVAKTVELKARGNFMNVVEPVYVQVLYASNQSQDKTTGFVKFDGTDSYSGGFIDHEIGDDYSVSVSIGNVNNSSANGQISAVLVKDSNKNTIWGINLWACFNALKTVTYDNGTILTYDLGAGNTIDAYNDWKSQGCYFQWGRPWAFPYSDKDEFGWTRVPTSNAVTLAKSASTPWAMYNYNGEPYDWYWGDGNKTDRSGDLDDLWGNPTSSGVGVKSIYDPCPKGYRVADPAILNEIESGINASIDETTGAITSAEGAATEIVTSTSLYYLKHKGVAWSFAGAHQNASGSNSRIENKVDAAVYWSNAISGNQARAMWVRKKKANNKYSIERLTGRSRALAAQVRCMVDTEDR
ncbi:MAG: hypothetical protein IKV05_03090 [Bacteroidales bacterium]|nr:hypothetical protein [Bacteroidales bacterium]